MATAHFGWPKYVVGDAPNGPVQTGALADAIDTSLWALAGAWQAWTPALTAVTTNPILGTGGYVTGKYVALAKLVIARFDITFGTAATGCGDGNYSLSLPVNCSIANATVMMGVAYLFDSSTGTVNLAAIRPNTSSTLGMHAHGGTLPVSAINPWVWDFNDSLRGMFVYEAA